MATETVSEELVIDAYRLFLGRAPVDASQHVEKTFDQLISSLFWSGEFQKSPRSKKNGLGWPEAQYFVSREKKVMYCPIGKVACSFMKRTMINLSEHPHKNVLVRGVHMMTDHVKTGLQLSDYGEVDVATMMNDPEMLRIAVLRDPARRLLSAYIEKFVKNRTEAGNVKHHTTSVVWPVQAAAGRTEPDFDLGITFREFVENITAAPAELLDPHWRPQSLYLGAYDWQLYTIEQLPELMARLEERSGVNLKATSMNVTGSGKGKERDGADRMLPADIDAGSTIGANSFLVPDLRAKIEAYYSDDYALIASTKLNEGS